MADIQRAKDPADPKRCQHVIPTKGQCPNLAVEGGENCLAHGGNKQRIHNEDQRLRNYRLSRAKELFGQMPESDDVKNLRDEILILRMLLQEFINTRCTTSNDLIIFSAPIADLVMKVTKVVEKCHKLEGSMGELLDKQAILQFAGEVIKVISDEFKDQPEKVSAVADKLMRRIGE